MPASALVFVVPGDLGSATGGYAYDRRMIAGLRATGHAVTLVSLAAGFPWPDAAAQAHAAQQLGAIGDGARVVVDGLAFGALPALAEQHAARLRWVALVHHPLALETGLGPEQGRTLFDSERRALATARGVIVTSAATARALARYGVAAERVQVVHPGTDPAPLATGPGPGAGAGAARQAGLCLLCVATLIPRKGHAVLIEALRGLQDRAWTLHCVGSATRDAGTARALRAAITAQGLGGRVRLHGEVSAPALQALYAQADAFVLATYFEGYGMALAEALAHGLPVVSTTAGAIPDTVPADAGLLVPPGDVAALRAALAALLDEPALRARLASGARSARAALPSWPQAVARFAAALASIDTEAVPGVAP
ncbi:MAG: glycosyltransferase family 4 protein [Burkholderiales bacterium]|nr:glycosyltransferase family 4 protein [Burkholderiales bacterium]